MFSRYFFGWYSFLHPVMVMERQCGHVVELWRSQRSCADLMEIGYESMDAELDFKTEQDFIVQE